MITIVNYGMGNIRSVQSALGFLGVEHRVSDLPHEILSSDRLILPGVGSFAAAMRNIRDRGLFGPLQDAVRDRGTPILGICLGMQLLADSGDEDGPSEGLGWIPGNVTRFQFEDPELKVPHVGFNEVGMHLHSPFFAGLGERADFYFVHSFQLVPPDARWVTGWTDYGGRFPAAVQRDNVFGAQFHPEKSQSNGLKALRNFVSWKA